MARRSDPNRRGGDAWAFLDSDGKPLTPYLGWLHYETQQIRKWTREHWTSGDTSKRRRLIAAGVNPAEAHP